MLSVAESELSDIPFYLPQGKEEDIFAAAFRQHLAILLRGPTGSGKTRFVEYMAARLGRPLVTVACHEDMSASDLIGRHLLVGGDTIWSDGPLTKAVRQGAICYLDEIVEARQDTTVVLHALSDHRRQLPIDRLATVLDAAPGFTLVISYNPGYQGVHKQLKPSTLQRFIGIELGYPPGNLEQRIIMHEAGVQPEDASSLVTLAHAIRRLPDSGLREVASTRLLVAAGRLIATGIPKEDAVEAAIIQPLTEDAVTLHTLRGFLKHYV